MIHYIIPKFECEKRKLTGTVILIVDLTMDERAKLLKVLSGLVEDLLQGTYLLVLVGTPVSLVAEVEDAKRLRYQIGDAGQ